jgi:UPF0755 protein
MTGTKKLLCATLVVLVLTSLVGVSLLAFIYFPATAVELFGQPASDLGILYRIVYSFRLVMGRDALLKSSSSVDSAEFIIDEGESVNLITLHLEQEGLIPDAELFRIYLIYSGMDKTIQAGKYELKGSMSPVQIAIDLQNASSAMIVFGILPGWRKEEVAASLDSSGLQITGQEFLEAMADPSKVTIPATLENPPSVEGFLFPTTYEFARDINVDEMLSQVLEKFAEVLTPEMKQAFGQHGLTIYQAVTLASIVQREAVHEEEMPLIASVFMNRMAIGMNLDSDPTVQYAIGYLPDRQSWWKNPLTSSDLQIDSPYNTYLYTGLPPTPICNPGLAALEAVAFPASSDYLYFRSKCDGSGYHNFAKTYEEQLGNACP